MRRTLFNTGLAWLFVMLVPSLPLHASVASSSSHGPAREYTKSINKRFRVASAGTLILDNRHGDIDLSFWERDEVSVSVTIVVEAGNEQRAQAIFDRVDVSFTAGSNQVEVRTALSEMSNRWGGSTGGTELKINYAVRAPAGFAPELINRYGATRVADVGTDARFDIAYGSLVAGRVAGRTELKASYSQASFGELKAVIAEISYSQCDIRQATDIELDARYSQFGLLKGAELELKSRYGEYTIGSVNTLTNDGRYDGFTIDSAWNLTVESRYTNLSINYLADVANMRLHYGSALIKEVAPGFARVDLAGNYTDFDIRVGESVPFSLEGEGKYVDFELPSYFTRVRREVVGTNSKFAGQHGAGEGGEVIVRAERGSVRIR